MLLHSLPVWIALAVPTHNLDLSTVAVFEHVDQPFTQGLVVSLKPTCPGPVDEVLNECLLEKQFGKRAQCYSTSLAACTSLYETSGLYNQSYIQRIDDFNRGVPSVRELLPDKAFAEGLTILENGDLLVATWREHRLFRLRDEESNLSIKEEMVVLEPSEMWGLTSNGNTTVWMTSGGAYLYEFEMHELGAGNTGQYKIGPLARGVTELSVIAPKQKVHIHDEGRVIRRVNEIEYHPTRGTIWGNIWMKDLIVEIDPQTGKVVGELNLGAYPWLGAALTRRSSDDVWNGITFLGEDWLIFTGKRFPYIFIGKLKLGSR